MRLYFMSVQQVHDVFRLPLRDTTIKWESWRLALGELERLCALTQVGLTH